MVSLRAVGAKWSQLSGRDKAETYRWAALRGIADVPELKTGQSLGIIREASTLWEQCVPVVHDKNAMEWLKSRKLDPDEVARLDLARAIPSGIELPKWACCRGKQWDEGGWRLVIPCFDHHGRIVSLKARQIDGKEGPKEVSPSSIPGAGSVFADPVAQRILKTGKWPPWLELSDIPKLVYVAEGGPDFLTLATFAPAGKPFAVVGIAGMKPTAEITEKVFRGAVVVILTDPDKEGERYAKKVTDLASTASRVVRGKSDQGLDLSDLHKSGVLYDALCQVPAKGISTEQGPISYDVIFSRPVPRTKPIAEAVMQADSRWSEEKHECPMLLREPVWEEADELHAGPTGMRDYMPKGKVCMLVGPGGVGKTSLCADLAMAVASGGSWLGRYQAERPGRVAMILGENDSTGAMRLLGRMARLSMNGNHNSNGANIQLIMKNIFVLPLAGYGDVSVMTRATNERLWVRTKRGDELLRTLDALQPLDLIIVDPLSRFGGPDFEIENAAATRLVMEIESLTELDGNPTVLVTHHTNKSGLSMRVASQSVVRGSSALVDAARWIAAALPMTVDLLDPADMHKLTLRVPGAVRVEVVKSNETATGSVRHVAYWGGPAGGEEGWRGADHGVVRLAVDGMCVNPREPAGKRIARVPSPQSFAEAYRIGLETTVPRFDTPDIDPWS